MRKRQLDEEAGKLLEACNAARETGADFPSIWHDILKNHRLVSGPPIQRYDKSGPILEIQLATRARIVFGAMGFTMR